MPSKLEYNRLWRKTPKGVAAEKRKYERHKEAIKARAIEWQKNNRERYNARLRAWRASKSKEHKTEVWLKQREYIRSLKGDKLDSFRATRRRLRAEYVKRRTPEQITKDKESTRRSRERTKEARYARERERNKIRRKTDIQFQIAMRLRSRLGIAMYYYRVKKWKPTFALLGISIDGFIKHVESQFVRGMNWGNRHLWHIDHIIPCSKFDLSKPDQQAACFHFSNHRPMWKKENLSKGARIVPCQPEFPLALNVK